jgi:hypothetical protein
VVKRDHPGFLRKSPSSAVCWHDTRRVTLPVAVAGSSVMKEL